MHRIDSWVGEPRSQLAKHLGGGLYIRVQEEKKRPMCNPCTGVTPVGRPPPSHHAGTGGDGNLGRAVLRFGIRHNYLADRGRCLERANERRKQARLVPGRNNDGECLNTGHAKI
ncbi:hypothetical protein GCM10022255_069730 [Dactylosporangium darangshiense]|uniref:Uncharacterized protein n=1 Tax=Dactylosporangium darangshiense TaxID=579108 RepID=A0ABP8DI02_9ACTN